MRMPICLNMIVKDENHVIKRCLETVKGLIDYWVIVDTGSTDGTQKTIKEFLQDIPGELHERPWVNFAHNRNEALTLARGKGDYFLFIDADDRLVFEKGFSLPRLKEDRYYVMQHVLNQNNPHAHMDHPVLLLMKDLPDFTWTGVLHETIISPQMSERSYAFLGGVINEYRRDGARSKDPDTTRKDIEMLEKALQNDQNQTTAFYLAQTYKSAKNTPAAIRYYQQAAALPGREDVAFYSLFSIGWLQPSLKLLADAYLYRPSRIEPLFVIARHYLEIENYFLAYLVAKLALTIPLPPATDLFIESWLYDWAALRQFYISALHIGEYKEAEEAGRKLLANPRFPTEYHHEVKRR